MIHFLYLIAFAGFVSVAFGVFNPGKTHEKVRYSVKIFLQFVLVSLALAWIFYFIPW